MPTRKYIEDIRASLIRRVRDQREKDSHVAPIHHNRAQRRAEKARQRLRLKIST